MQIKAIVAVDENNGIGYQGDLLFKIKADMQHFVEQTGTDPVIMRRGTFESFGARPLPRRTNIVITRQTDYEGNGARVVSSLEEALKQVPGAETVWIIGGAGLYKEALPITHEIQLTQIFGHKEADTFFPTFKEFFDLTEASEMYFDEGYQTSYQFQTWIQKED